MTVATTGKSMPQRMTRCLLVLFLVGICSRGYGYYNQDLKASPQIWMDVVHGTASAPEQYRIGVVMTAYWLSEHVPLRLSQIFGLLDLLTSVTAVMLLYGVLVRTRVYTRAGWSSQWFGSAAFLALTVYLVDWINWYQKATTLPSACLVAAMLWVWTPKPGVTSTTMRRMWVFAAFLALVAMQSFLRADVALMVCAGILVASATRMTGELSLPRGWAVLCSLMAGVVAVAVQLYLMKVRYPKASYGDVPVWMIVHDWYRVSNWISALVFMAPFLWTLRQVVGRGYRSEGAGTAFLLAATGYAGIWLVMGRLDEVRIFLPLALAVTPLTVEVGMSMLEGPLGNREALRGGNGLGS